ncbi:MAG: FHA domain-containing protein [Anaerolineales bacterium]|nr:FHA domain-containing protein [Anaerolineales bacterium]
MSEIQWLLIIRVSNEKPRDYELKPGDNTIGRHLGNDIVIDDISASRQHAVINYDLKSDAVTIYDRDSTNGSFVNRERLTKKQPLRAKDVIRIGSTVLKLVRPGAGEATRELTGTHPLTRERVLEALDHNAVLMYEVSERLNAVMDLSDALSEVAELMKKAMGADRCKVILADEFASFQELGFPKTLAETAIETASAVVLPHTGELQPSDSAVYMRLSAALCVPVIAHEDVIALIYMYKTDPKARLFTQNDLQVGVAISHQAALTIQRMQLMNQVQKEQRVRQVLQRFVSPQETEYLLKDYASQDGLPDPTEKYVTVLFSDITDSTGLAERLGARKFGQLLIGVYTPYSGVK